MYYLVSFIGEQGQNRHRRHLSCNRFLNFKFINKKISGSSYAPYQLEILNVSHNSVRLNWNYVLFDNIEFQVSVNENEKTINTKMTKVLIESNYSLECLSKFLEEVKPYMFLLNNRSYRIVILQF